MGCLNDNKDDVSDMVEWLEFLLIISLGGAFDKWMSARELLKTILCRRFPIDSKIIEMDVFATLFSSTFTEIKI